MPGSQMSRRITSKGLLRTASKHASPLAAAAAVYPSSSNTPCNDSRMVDSSSTMRMLSMWRLGRHGGSVACERKFDNKASTHWLIFFDPDRSLVFLDDAAHNRQPQTSTTFRGWKVREEELL